MSKKLRIAAALGALLAAAAAHAAWQVGDKVRVWVSADYYDGTVVEVGSGDHAGQYRIRFDHYNNEQYALAKNVLPRKTAPAGPPQDGKTGSNGCRIMVLNNLPFCDPGSVKKR